MTRDEDAEAAKAAETARKKSEAMRAKYQDPEFRKRQAQGSLETWKDPEYRTKISKARREQHARGKAGHAVGHDDV